MIARAVNSCASRRCGLLRQRVGLVLFAHLSVGLMPLLACMALQRSLRAEDRPSQLVLPHWIWRRETPQGRAPENPEPASHALQRTVELGGMIQSATLRVAADFCSASVQINGQPLIRVEPYSPTIEVDATPALRVGNNEIVVLAHAVGGPAAVALSLTLATPAGRSTIVTDERWTTAAGEASATHAAASGAAAQPAISLGTVDPALWGVGRRPATIDAFENYEQWRQASGPSADKAVKFWTAPGFHVSLLRTAQPDEGSWVSMAFDPAGRLTIAREDKGLLRMTLGAETSMVTRVETINDDLLECRGLLYAYGALYANANNSKGLYRLRDTDGDDRFDEVRRLRHFPGSVGHGRNDLALGPDGMIYSIHGDAVDVPASDITDWTSPLREARQGKTTREGHLLRTDRDGQQWELVCAGLRNPFGVAFNSDGEAFTYDADAEFDMGSPWYRPTRIVQLVRGADYGWRGVTGKWPPYFPDHADNAVPTLDIGKGSPTAVALGSETNFPADYRRALFVLDWAYGRILAVHLAPRGAGYRAQAETFLQGRPLNVTDLAVGPDGALYLITGGRQTQSALYRVAYTVGSLNQQPLSPHEIACREHASAARALRRSIEGAYQATAPSPVAAAWPHLDSPDPWIRYAARLALEHQPLASWREKALAENRATAALTALMAISRAGEAADLSAVVERLLAFSASELTVGQTLMLLQAYAVCRERAPKEVMGRSARLLAQLDGLFPLTAERRAARGPLGSGVLVERELAKLLVELKAPAIVERAARSLLASDLQEDRLHGLFVLRDVRQGWSLAARRAYFTALNEAAANVGGEGMPRFLATLRQEALATLSDSERQHLTDLLSPAAGRDEPLPPPRPAIKHWTVADLAGAIDDPLRQGNAERGAAVFRDALCVRCHRAGARGPAVGPDLTHVARRFSRRDILESILRPAAVVAENYRNVQVRTADGRTIVGRVLMEGDYRSQTLRIATDPLVPAAVTELNKRDIDEVRESDTSPMPEGLLDPFREDEILDLLAFLERGAMAPAPTTGAERQ